MLEVVSAKRMSEGEGVTVHRLFPIIGARMNHDPFVLFDHFEVGVGQGFPTHPHRGFEGVTYLFSGSMRHTDNLGNDSVITKGGAQIFCAGRGIEHSEMPDSRDATRGIQLWINLAKKVKTIEPSYQSVDAEELPESAANGVKVITIVGDSSPVKLQNKAIYQCVEMSQDSSYEINVSDKRGLVYMISGTLRCSDKAINESQALIFNSKESTLFLRAETNCHFMIAYGEPHGEPIIQYGPFVD
jgi:quercetin 2,3-dioxygenase